MRFFIFFFTCFWATIVQAQDTPSMSRWEGHFQVGQYAASLGVPKFTPLHLGVGVGASYGWNTNEKHRFKQSANLQYFYHQNLQSVVQLYTELGYEWRTNGGFRLMPLAIGGGYVRSVSGMTTLEWDAASQRYVSVQKEGRNNWLISVGTTLGYETDWKVAGRPMAFFLSYRLQVQGVLVEENVPLIAYTPLILGVSLPF